MRPFKLLFLLLSLLPLALTASLATQSLSTNLLSSLFPASTTSAGVHATAQSSHLLPDGTLALAGVIVYPPDYIAHPRFADAPSLAPRPPSTARTSAFVARVSPDGSLLWALRVAALPAESPVVVSAVNTFDHVIYLAGRTSGLTNRSSSADAVLPPGPFVVAVAANGTLIAAEHHPTAGSAFVAVDWHPSRREVLVLLATADKDASVFDGVEHPPAKKGLSAALVGAVRLDLRRLRPLSNGPQLVKDTFWSLACAPDGATFYVAVRRQTVANWVHSLTPTLFAFKVDTLALRGEPRALPKDLQNRMVVRADEGGPYVAYVSRTKNKEFLVVRRLSPALDLADWDGAFGSLFEREIVMDLLFTRTIRSDVVDMLLDGNGNIRVLLHTAEIVDDLDHDFEKNRRLTNGRPALVVITRQKTVSHITQSVSSEQWRPYSLLNGTDHFYVLGSDEGQLGSQLDSYPRLLLTTIEHDALPSPSPVFSSKPTPSPIQQIPGTGGGDINFGDIDIPSVLKCIGASTMIKGRSFENTVRADPRLRVQRHPLLKLRSWAGLEHLDGKVSMLCMSWRNGTENEDTLCATPQHVMRWHGQEVFMQELCHAVGRCVVRRETPINFKGPCGADVPAHEFLGITMHAASHNNDASAHEVAREECVQRSTRPLRWLVSTL